MPVVERFYPTTGSTGNTATGIGAGVSAPSGMTSSIGDMATALFNEYSQKATSLGAENMSKYYANRGFSSLPAATGALGSNLTKLEQEASWQRAQAAKEIAIQAMIQQMVQQNAQAQLDLSAKAMEYGQGNFASNLELQKAAQAQAASQFGQQQTAAQQQQEWQQQAWAQQQQAWAQQQAEAVRQWQAQQAYQAELLAWYKKQKEMDYGMQGSYANQAATAAAMNSPIGPFGQPGAGMLTPTPTPTRTNPYSGVDYSSVAMNPGSSYYTTQQLPGYGNYVPGYGGFYTGTPDTGAGGLSYI